MFFEFCGNVGTYFQWAYVATLQNLRHAEITIYPSQTDGKLKHTSFGKTTAASSEEISTIRCVCMCFELIQRETKLWRLSCSCPQRAHLSPHAPAWSSGPALSASCTLIHPRCRRDVTSLACSLSLTAALQQSYTRTADLHQRCASLALLHLIKVLHRNKRRADYSIDQRSSTALWG